MTGDHLTPDARDAHGRMLAAFDAVFRGVIERERRAMREKLVAEGATLAEAVQGAEDHVARLLAFIEAERAALEAEAVRERH